MQARPPPATTPPARSWRNFAAIALVASTVLLYQVTITRVLSVVLWYHFAFLSVSLAMLGLGASGVWFALRKPRPGSLGLALGCSAVLLPASVITVLNGQAMLESHNTWLVLVVVSLVLPMLSLGGAVCLLLLSASGKRIGSMYGADLVGATVGAALAVPAMTILPAPAIIAATGLLPLAAWMLVRQVRPRVALPIAAAVVATLAWGEPLRVRHNKSYSEEQLAPVFERWTPSARITVFDRPIWSHDQKTPWGWGLGMRYEPKPVSQMWIDQDGSAGTPIEHPGDNIATLEHLAFDVTGAGYQLLEPERVCIIGAGGGRDILTALRGGAREVDAVEINRAIVEALSGPFAEFSGDVYHMPGVTPVIAEGRSYLMRSEKDYDLIQISLVDSWAATAAGAYALSENFLYTVEAFELYLSRLREGGVVSVSRWSSGTHRFESARLVLLATAALAQRGATDPTRHLALLAARGVCTLLVSNRPFDEVQLGKLDAIAVERGFGRLWPVAGDEEDHPAQHVLLHGPEKYERLGLDLSPPTDDRPFFFQRVAILRSQDALMPGRAGFNEQSVTLLRKLLIVLLGLSVALFFAPFALVRKLERCPGFWRGSGYFAAIGLAFMFVEVPWIQRAILYLGRPSHATAVVLASLLLGAGLGSTAAARVDVQRLLRWRWLLPAGVAAIYALATLPYDTTLGASFGIRVVVCAMSLLPAGFLMGFAFPLGMIHFGDRSRAWFWALNGAASVLASALSLVCAMALGFSGVVAAGVGIYLIAVLLIGGPRVAKNDTPSPEVEVSEERATIPEVSEAGDLLPALASHEGSPNTDNRRRDTPRIGPVVR